jgi:copper resistance protein D
MQVWTLSMVLAAAAFYASALVATGGVLFKLAFAWEQGAVGLHRSIVAASWLALALLFLQWPLQAGFLGGSTLAAAVDPMLLGVVFDGAQGSRTILAASGLLLLHGVLIDSGRMRYLGFGVSVIGVILVFLAFTQVGHTRDEPRWLLGGLLLVHLAAVAFWVGALLPLYRMAGQAVPHKVAARVLVAFGRGASVTVGLLLAAAAALSWLLVGGIAPFLETGYGQTLLIKIALVLLLLALAALNKWRLVPAFERGEPNADRRLRRSIRGEGLLVLLILLVTALMTTTTSPNG